MTAKVFTSPSATRLLCPSKGDTLNQPRVERGEWGEPVCWPSVKSSLLCPSRRDTPKPAQGGARRVGQGQAQPWVRSRASRRPSGAVLRKWMTALGQSQA